MKDSVYNYKVLDFSNEERSLEEYRGKVLLVVNTASGCYFRNQFKPLEELYQLYKDQGFEILAFPSNNFLQQEPRTGRNLETYCRVQEQITFPVYKRIHVKGEFIHPLYNYLSNKSINGLVDSKPLWNFHKYLIDKNGQVVDYYYPITDPLAKRVQDKIKYLLEDTNND